MPTKVNNVFDKALTFEAIYKAHIRARKNKTNRKDVIKFEMNLENNLVNLLNSLKNGTYKPGKYTIFTIYEPKERSIMSLPYKDRIVHQWYVEEFIKPYILPKLISTTYACIPSRGTHKAVEKAQEFMRKMYRKNKDFWVLKCDIKKYFYTIDKDILFSLIERNFKDKKFLNFTKTIIYSNLETEKKGIPIGNYTSQFFC